MPATNWTTTTDEHGWMTLKRGNCRITVPPDGARGASCELRRVALYAPACMTEHATIDAAKRAATTRLNRGW